MSRFQAQFATWKRKVERHPHQGSHNAEIAVVFIADHEGLEFDRLWGNVEPAFFYRGRLCVEKTVRKATVVILGLNEIPSAPRDEPHEHQRHATDTWQDVTVPAPPRGARRRRWHGWIAEGNRRVQSYITGQSGTE